MTARFVLCVFAWLIAGTATADTTFRVRVAVAGSPAVVDRTWLETQITRANDIFEPAEVSFVLQDVVPLPSDDDRWPIDLVTRADRHRLGPLVEANVINIFVVRSMADVDVAGRFIRGVHWRSRRGGSARHYCILSSIAGPTVLAHELGHFFGNPHSATPGNIMSYERGHVPPFLDDGQIRRIRRSARRFVRRRELRPM